MKIHKVLAMLAIAVSANASGQTAQGQTIAAPKEVPPSSYAGRQYVDSTGCAFIRAGTNGVVQWVPRVTRNRRLVCGLQPTLAAGTPTPQAAPRVRSPEVLVITPAPAAPPINRPTVQNRAAGAPPVASGLAGTVVTPGNAASKGVTQTMRVLPRHVYEKKQDTMSVTVPDGYRSVWQDDRLNPRRAEQTLNGHERMQQIWTKKAPRRLVD